MNRRTFVASASALTTAAASAEAEQPAGRSVYDLRTFSFATAESLEAFAKFFATALAPAAKRLGSCVLGGFTVADKPDALKAYLLLAYPSWDAYTGFERRLFADEEFRAQGADHLNAPPTAPAYAHASSQIMTAFESWPAVTPPREAAANGPRIFELRTYESHSKRANRKKIEMFDRGEAVSFARAGMQPVFYGETVAGPQIPNLTYMLTYPSADARAGLWQKWRADPEVGKLFQVPEYADKLILTKITAVMLKPLPGSAI